MLYVCVSALTLLPSQKVPQCSTLKISLFPERLVWLGSQPFSKKEETFPLNTHGVGFSQHSLSPSVTWWMRVRLDVWPCSKGQHKPRYPLTPERATNNDFASILVTIPLNSTVKHCNKSTPHLRMFTMAIALNNLRAMLARDLPCDFRYIINLWHTEVIQNSYSRSTELEDYLWQKTLLLLHLKIRHDYPKALFSIVKVIF